MTHRTELHDFPSGPVGTMAAAVADGARAAGAGPAIGRVPEDRAVRAARRGRPA